MLDPAQNDSFTDHYLNVPFDLSEVLFIATANFLQNIPAPLLDRMEVVDFSGYTEREKAEIAKTYLIPRQLDESGLADEQVTFTDDAVMDDRQPIHPRERRPPARAADRRRGPEGGPADRGGRGGRRGPSRPTTSASCWAGPGSTPSTPPRPTRWASRPGCITPRPAATSCSSRPRSASSTASSPAGGDGPVRRLGQRLA